MPYAAYPAITNAYCWPTVTVALALFELSATEVAVMVTV
jgi:hypothetical protein